MKPFKFIMILLVLLTNCVQNASNSTFARISLETEQIDRIEISKRSTPPDTTTLPFRILTEEQVKSFCDKLNDNTKSELCKYFAQYTLVVYLKNGSTRHFRIGGKYIKENNDYCIDFSDNNYFLNLYLQAMQMTVK